MTQRWVAMFIPLAQPGFGPNVMVIEGGTIDDATRAATAQADATQDTWRRFYTLDILPVSTVIKEGTGLARGLYTAYNRDGKAVRVTIPED